MLIPRSGEERENEGISTSIFWKATRTDHCLNCHSHHLFAGVVNCLCQRTVRVRDSTTIQGELDHHNVLRANGYMSSNTITDSTIHKIYQKQHQQGTSEITKNTGHRRSGCASLISLVPRPRGRGKTRPGIYCLHMRVLRP